MLARVLARQDPSLSRAEVEAALREVLARPEYAPPEPPLLVRWMGAAQDWLATHVWPLLDRLIPRPDLEHPGWETAARVALFAGALLGVALILYLAVLAVRAWRQRRRRARRAEPVRPRAPLTAGEWDAMARAAAGRGEWRSAAMALYQAVLLRLGESGAVRVEASKTPGDYRREVRQARSDLLPRLEAFLRWFERVAYGRAAPDAEQYARLTESASSLLPHG